MTRARALIAWGLLALAGPADVARAQQPLGPGDMAPPFTLPGTDGRVHSLSDHLGRRPVVLAWFPRVFATR